MIIYAIDLEKLSQFYQQALGFVLEDHDQSYHRLLFGNKNLPPSELVLLQAPSDIVAQVSIESPPVVRAATPVKPVFSLSDSIASYRKQVEAAGGLFNDTDTEWNFNGDRVCDGVDVEGNVFQIRTLDLQNLPLTLREAAIADLELLQSWEEKPHVIAAGIDDGWQWATELQRKPSWREFLIALHAERPIGIVQIIDPAREDSHYWGDVGPNLRAIDIWLGEQADLGRGFGSEIMRQVLDRCFEVADVTAILIDQLARNTRAHRFYQSLGFEFLEARTFDDDDCFVYQLTRDCWQSRGR